MIIRHPLQARYSYKTLNSRINEWWRTTGQVRYRNVGHGRSIGKCVIHPNRPENNYEIFNEEWGLCNKCIDESLGYVKSKTIIQILNTEVK
jgi:hypothetical protein